MSMEIKKLLEIIAEHAVKEETQDDGGLIILPNSKELYVWVENALFEKIYDIGEDNALGDICIHKESLVASCTKLTWPSKQYILKLPEKKEIFVGENNLDYIRLVCSHNDELFCAIEHKQQYGIYKEGKKIAHRTKEMYALWSHDGTLYDAGQRGVFKTEEDAFGKNPVIEECVCELITYKGKLYGQGGKDHVWDVLAKNKTEKLWTGNVTATPNRIINLYRNHDKGIYLTDWETLKDLGSYSCKTDLIVKALYAPKDLLLKLLSGF